jgi:hypothetical protein
MSELLSRKGARVADSQVHVPRRAKVGKWR